MPPPSTTPTIPPPGNASVAGGERLVGPARWAAAAAALCGVHCLLTPALATALPFLAVTRAAEWWALGITVTVGAGVTLLGPSRHRRGVLALLAVGAGIWCASLLDLFAPLPETLTAPVGSLVFAGGMLWSARICRTGACDRCHPESDNDAPVGPPPGAG